MKIIKSSKSAKPPLIIQGDQAALQFSAAGHLTGIRLSAKQGWRETRAIGPVAARRRPGEYFLQCDKKSAWLSPASVAKKGGNVALSCESPDARLDVTWQPVFGDAFLATCTVTAKRNLKSVAIGLDAFNLPAREVKSVYCLPLSLPFIRNEQLNSIPAGYIDNGETMNNTFSLITKRDTFSLSILPPAHRLGNELDPASARDYLVGFADAALQATYVGKCPSRKSADKNQPRNAKDYHLVLNSGNISFAGVKRVVVASHNLVWNSEAKLARRKCRVQAGRGGRTLNVFFGPVMKNAPLPDRLHISVTFRNGKQAAASLSRPSLGAGLPVPAAGSIILIANHGTAVKRGETVTRQFLLSATPNGDGYASGYHIGQYMNLVRYTRRTNALELYRKSTACLLDNPHCYTDHPQYGKNYWGSFHSGTGDGFGNGRAFYAMYGNSFTIAALNQFAAFNKLNPHSIDRLQGPNHFLLDSEILTPDGAYWSMADLEGKGCVDQAYRKWVETHATGWVTYYLLTAYEIGGNQRYLETAKKSLRWLASVQHANGSFPKYFEDGKPSAERQGDSAWNALSFFKAHELKVKIPGVNLRQRGVKATKWIVDRLVPDKQYCGSFEDVGGVVDSYCSTICARAAMETYKATSEAGYLQAARDALSVSLVWVSCDYSQIGDFQAWDRSRAFQPAYGHVESVSCYYQCAYTLPMIYLAASELAALTRGAEREYWLQLSRQFSHLDKFFADFPGAKGRFGMEWRPFPFLIFTEWGNSQTCWTIMETYRRRARIAVPALKLNSRMEGTLNGKSVTAFAPKWDDATGNLLDTNPEIDPLVLRADDGVFHLLLLAEGREIAGRLALKALANELIGDRFSLVDAVTGRVIGRTTRRQLRHGVPITVRNHLLLTIRQQRMHGG